MSKPYGGALRPGVAAAVWAAAYGFQSQPPRPAALKRPHFTDVAPRSKFAYITNNGLSQRKYFPQPLAGGVAVFDFDNDGKLDIFFTNGAKLPELKKTGPAFYNCLLRNKGNAVFEDVTRKAGLAGESLDYNFGVAVGDYDNDGHEDLFVCSAGRNALYHNNGNGTFTDVTRESGIGGKPPGTVSVGAAWFDYDRDGLPDLVVANYTDLESADRSALRVRGRGVLLRSASLCAQRSAAVVSQPGAWQVRGRDGEVRLRARAGQRHGNLDRGFQWRRLAGRVYRQRYGAQFAVHQQRRRHIRRAGPAIRRGLRRQRQSGILDGQRRARL
jgi:hypothetical protein